jgi:hypothetical protein
MFDRLRQSNIKTVDNQALGPVPLHDPGNLRRTLILNKSADKIQSRIYASAHAPTCNYTKTAKAHRCAAGNGLAT